MSQKYRVNKNDCISSIAFRFGFLPETLWDHAENADLKKKRAQDGRVLKEGDVVFIPDKREKQFGGDTEQRHRFVRKGVPEVIQLVLLDMEGKPRPNIKYQLLTDINLKEGETNGDGELREFISPLATQATLLIDAQGNEPEYEYELDIGGLNPLEDGNHYGVQMRLNNLGYDPGQIDGVVGDIIKSQIKNFQADKGLKENGKMDDEFRNALKSAHRS